MLNSKCEFVFDLTVPEVGALISVNVLGRLHIDTALGVSRCRVEQGRIERVGGNRIPVESTCEGSYVLLVPLRLVMTIFTGMMYVVTVAVRFVDGAAPTML